MKYKTPYSRLPIQLLFISLSLPFISGFYYNQLQDVTLDLEYSIKGSAFINLENIVGYTVANEIFFDNSQSCKLQNTSLSQTSVTPFNGFFSTDSKAIYCQGSFYVIKLDPVTSKVALISYKQGNSNSYSGLVASENRLFDFQVGTDREILATKRNGFYTILSTKTNLLLFEFSSYGTPTLHGVLTSTVGSIRDFGLVDNSKMFVAEENKLVVYNIKSGPNTKNPLATFSNLTLSTDKQWDTKDIQSICVSEDIIYFGIKNVLVMARGSQELNESEGLKVLTTKELSADIVKIVKAGRSLVVLTATELIEYVFVNDLLQFKPNQRISVHVFGFGINLSVDDKQNNIDIIASDNQTYFALVNKPQGSIYIFQTASQQFAAYSPSPYLYHYAGNNGALRAVEIYESPASSSNIRLIIHGKGQIETRQLQRNPLGLVCSKWVAGTSTISVAVKSQFCHNKMYNFTKFVEEELKPRQMNVFTSDYYFDPTMPCNKTMLIRIKYEWALTFLLSLLGIFAATLITLLLIKKLCSRKQKKENKKEEIPHLKIPHKRFHNEKEKSNFDHSASHKIDVSHFNLPSTTDRNQITSNGNVESRDMESQVPASKRKKNFTKKKNLEIRIPETKY